MGRTSDCGDAVAEEVLFLPNDWKLIHTVAACHDTARFGLRRH